MQGLIISNITNIYNIKVENKIYEGSARGKFKLTTSPVVGDKVEIEVLDEENKKAIINEILPRKTYIKRPKIANINQIVFVVSLDNPKPDLLLLDKQLAFSKLNNIEPIIVISKIDLKSNKNEEILNNMFNIYTKIGYKVIQTKAKENFGTHELNQILKGKITAFSGNSGVGKSTLINSIFGKSLTQEGEISSKNKKGKNTTTAITLYEIDENSYIADTPRIFHI